MRPTDAASASGPDPFTPSTANTATALPAAAPVDAPTQAGAIRSVSGGEVGLYGGTRNSPACDVEKQIRYVTADTGRNKAFASSLNVQPSAVPGYLRSLTPLQLRSDTRVTNHGYKNGTSTGYQSVLQSGTVTKVHVKEGDDVNVTVVRVARDVRSDERARGCGERADDADRDVLPSAGVPR